MDSRLRIVRCATLRGHRLSDAHRFLIKLQHMGFLEQAIEQLEARILQQINRANLICPFELLQTIPAIRQAAAAARVAEIGCSVDPFSSPKKLASWAGLCPGNKTLGTNCTKGNQWLRTTLAECAWAASMQKESSFQVRFKRLSPRIG